jgi:hypothetical protein
MVSNKWERIWMEVVLEGIREIETKILVKITAFFPPKLQPSNSSIAESSIFSTPTH